MIYGVGDQVLIRDDLVSGADYGDVYFVDQMARWRGKIMTIKGRDQSFWSEGYDYEMCEDGGRWTWSEEMFVGIVGYAENTYKVGDKVRILSKIPRGCIEHLYRGKVFTITDVSGSMCYAILDDRKISFNYCFIKCKVG